MLLIDVLSHLERLSDDHMIYGSLVDDQWTLKSLAIIMLWPEDGNMQPLLEPADLQQLFGSRLANKKPKPGKRKKASKSLIYAYIFRADAAREVLSVWTQSRAGRIPTADERLAAIVYHAKHGSHELADAPGE